MTRDPLMPEVLDGFDRALRRRPARRRRHVPRALGITLLALAAGGTALAAIAPWNPIGSGPDAAVTRKPPTPDQLRTLAVLRRAQTDGDRGPLVTAFLRRSGEGATGGRIRLDYVRHLRDVEVLSSSTVDAGAPLRRRTTRASLYLIPQDGRRAKGLPPGVPKQQFCLAAVFDAWPQGTAPPDLAGARTAGGGAPRRPADLVERVTGGGACGSAHDVRVKGLASGDLTGGRKHGIVPDGVAAVRARTRDDQLVTAKVVNNSYELLAPGRNLPPDPHDRDPRPFAPPLSGQFKSGGYEWLDASGTVIRKMPY